LIPFAENGYTLWINPIDVKIKRLIFSGMLPINVNKRAKDFIFYKWECIQWK